MSIEKKTDNTQKVSKNQLVFGIYSFIQFTVRILSVFDNKAFSVFVQN